MTLQPRREYRRAALLVMTALACVTTTARAGVPPGAIQSRAAVQNGQQPQPVQQAASQPAASSTPPSAIGQRAGAAVQVSTPPIQTAAPLPPGALQQPAANQSPTSQLVGKRGAAALAKTPPELIPSTRVAADSPHRSDLLRAQSTVLAEQNQLAQAARRAVSGPMSLPSPRGDTLQKPGALAASTLAPRGPSLATKVAQRDDGKSFAPGIHTVNGKEQGINLTPGAYLTVNGYGFGDTVGSLALLTSVAQSRIELQIVDWHDNEVYALFPPGLRGLPDQSAKVQLTTRPGKIYLFDGAQFYGTREEVLVEKSLARVFRLEAGQSWPEAALEDNGAVLRLDGSYAAGFDCKAPGTDRVVFLPLPKGFEVTGVVFWHGRTDTGDGDDHGHAGSRAFFPDYSLGDWREEGAPIDRFSSKPHSVLHVSWGVWRSHTSPTAFDQHPSDVCQSYYRLAVSVMGPAGVPVY